VEFAKLFFTVPFLAFFYSVLPGPNYIPLQTTFHNLGLSSALRFRDQVSHQYKTTDKIICSLVLSFTF